MIQYWCEKCKRDRAWCTCGYDDLDFVITGIDPYVQPWPEAKFADDVIKDIRQRVIMEIAQCLQPVDGFMDMGVVYEEMGYFILLEDWGKITGAKIIRAKED